MKKMLRSILCFFMAVILMTEGNLGAFTTYAMEESVQDSMPTAVSYLEPFEEAVVALEELAAAKELQAVVYLTDCIMMRELPEEASEPMKELTSGDVVSILGVGQDAEQNIWYRVAYEDELEIVKGYLPQTNVACVDLDFAAWQENYVRSVAMFGSTGRSVSYEDVEAFPKSYRSALKKLKEKHPNWIFVKMNTNIEWKELVKSQVGERSLIWASTSKESWKNGMYSSQWAYASEGILKYYLDPRNWLKQEDIFQFELLGYYSQYHTVSAVKSILAGSFMANATIENGKTYAKTFVELGKETGVSPFLMAARVRQEQGTNGKSALISGTYKGYEGYYNYYNIGASGTTDKEVIVSGLKKAKAEGWNSRYKSLKGGAEFLGKSYIKAGQDTLYLQKFDVDNRYNGVFWHQYMQNIQAPYTEGSKVYHAYNSAGLLNQAFVFRIPVYNNMPSSAVSLPGTEDKITLSSTKITNLQVDSKVTLHPYINGEEAEGTEWVFTSSNPKVATVNNKGVVKALKTGKTTITCQNADDMDNPNVGTCKITVIPADIDLETLDIPQLDAITYDPEVTLKDIALPQGYSWVKPDMVPVATRSNYAVCYNPDEKNYNPITFDLALTVNKRKLDASDYTLPEGLEGGAARDLGSVSLPNGFLWKNPTEKLADKVGVIAYPASYNPDTANYETVENIKISVKIVCEKHVFTEWNMTEATCEEDGLKARKCTICARSEGLVLEKTGHQYESVITQEATEEKEGVRTYTCKNCGDSYTESIPKLPAAHTHEYGESIVSISSCTQEGLSAFACSCDDTYTEVIEATGHVMENGRCRNCGYTENEAMRKEEVKSIEKVDVNETKSDKPKKEVNKIVSSSDNSNNSTTEVVTDHAVSDGSADNEAARTTDSSTSGNTGILAEAKTEENKITSEEGETANSAQSNEVKIPTADENKINPVEIDETSEPIEIAKNEKVSSVAGPIGMGVTENSETESTEAEVTEKDETELAKVEVTKNSETEPTEAEATENSEAELSEVEVTENSETEEQKTEMRKLMIVCIIIMIFAGGLAATGYFIYFHRKEISDGQDFEEWLKEEIASNEEAELQMEKEERYLDEDVDDYREKEKGTEKDFNTSEIRLKEEDYLDEDVDDYKEKW